jgi:hypothetical protein
MPKIIKSAAELTELIMAELHKHSQCKEVLRIRITRPVTKNWDVTIMRSPGRVCPPVCRNILEATVQRLRALYDLPGKKEVRAISHPAASTIPDPNFPKHHFAPAYRD